MMLTSLTRPAAAICTLALSAMLHAQQFDLSPDDAIPVFENGQQLALAWAGGLNAPQFSPIDLDGDGWLDLFVFDRSGNHVLTLINNGIEGQHGYHVSRAYQTVPPLRDLHDWVLLRDYNCDGKPDIFTYSLGGAAVYKNTSQGGTLSFQLVDTLVRSNYVPTTANLFITSIDLPGIIDIDGDGDLDILTFSIFGAYVEYHKNLSMELYGHCDSLKFEVANRCWGSFSENMANNSVTLNNPCSFNVPNPQVTDDIEERMQLLLAARADGIPESDIQALRAHSGSAVTPLDLNGDGVMDLLLGDISFKNVTALFNGGTVDQSLMVATDTLFPDYDESVWLDMFPASFHVDVDNDGRRDLLVSPNSDQITHNFEGVWYYRNTGTDEEPVFQLQTIKLFQQDMIEVGEGAYPVLFDHNGDGLLDLLVANRGYFQSGETYQGRIALYENTGTASAPAFTLITRDYMGLSTSGIGTDMYPAFSDLDGDGDLDMLIGDSNGRVHLFRNIATGSVAQFQLEQPNITTTGGAPIDVGQHATPQLFDVDGDGLDDLIIGERNGNVNYYRNVGTQQQAAWTLEKDSLGGVVTTVGYLLTGFSVPFMYFNEDGERELLVGSQSGWIWRYGDIDGNLDGDFTLLDSTWMDIREGARTSIALADMNGNGRLDAFIGNYRGGVSFYRNGPSWVGVPEHAAPGQLGLLPVPNPADGHCELRLGESPGSDARLVVLDNTGREVARMAVKDLVVHIPTAQLPNGVYLLRLEAGGAVQSGRMVVLHH